jgi:hypothetical protein
MPDENMQFPLIIIVNLQGLDIILQKEEDHRHVKKAGCWIIETTAIEVFASVRV